MYLRSHRITNLRKSRCAIGTTRHNHHNFYFCMIIIGTNWHFTFQIFIPLSRHSDIIMHCCSLYYLHTAISNGIYMWIMWSSTKAAHYFSLFLPANYDDGLLCLFLASCKMELEKLLVNPLGKGWEIICRQHNFEVGSGSHRYSQVHGANKLLSDSWLRVKN